MTSSNISTKECFEVYIGWNSITGTYNVQVIDICTSDKVKEDFYVVDKYDIKNFKQVKELIEPYTTVTAEFEKEFSSFSEP